MGKSKPDRFVKPAWFARVVRRQGREVSRRVQVLDSEPLGMDEMFSDRGQDS